MAAVVRRTDKEHRLGSILAFAKNLEERLHSATSMSPSTDELYTQIDRILSVQKVTSANSFYELDAQGTRLWNLASKAKRAREASAEIWCLVRVFGCLLLDCAQRWTESSTPSDSICSEGSDKYLRSDNDKDDIRVLRCTLRTSKYCLDELQLSLAERIVERAAVYEAKLIRENHLDAEQAKSINQLSDEYHMLRITLAWRQDRLDIADLMYVKLSQNIQRFNSSLAEKIVDLLFEIGSDQSMKALHHNAVMWLERAHDSLINQNSDDMGSDAIELLFSIKYKLAKSFIALQGVENFSKAWNVIDGLDMASGSKLAFLLLKLDLYDADLSSYAQDYCDTLQRIIRTIHLTNSNLKTTLHHVHKLRGQSPRMAHVALEALLSERLSYADEPGWTEKVLITMIWNGTTSTGLADILNQLFRNLDELYTSSGMTISSSATHAAQVLLWKRIEANYNQEIYESAEAWCSLSLHKIFGQSGALNTGKLQRKLILCALGRSDQTKAREIYEQMSESNQRDPSTQYLMYKAALKHDDVNLASECLDSICKNSEKGSTLLYSCVLEAQRSGAHFLTLVSLQRVLSKYDYGALDAVHLPALLRCTARLLLREIDCPESQVQDGVNEVCKLFETAATHAKHLTRDLDSKLFSLPELNWFSRNSYNLALKVCTSWAPEQTLRLVQTSIKLIELYPTDLDSNTAADLSLRKLFCHFLCGSLLVLMARSEDRIEIELQHYLSIRKHAGEFRARRQEQLDRLEGGARIDLQHKYSNLLAFDFEAAARLKAWASFELLIGDCEASEDPKIYSVFADLTLSSEAPNEVIITTLQQIINASWRLDVKDIDKLSRWIRCLFSLALVSKLEMAEHLLDQVVTITREGLAKAEVYPPEELEWLAATTFNRAVDFYCSSQDADCRRWAEKALAIANLSSDGGALHELLQTKYMGLSWDHH